MTAAMVQAAVAAIRARAGALSPKVCIVTGSGLGDAVDAVDVRTRLRAAEIAGFPVSSVQGHAGQVLLGRLGGLDVAWLNGRAHTYEGHPPASLALPLRTMRALGCEAAVLVSTVGSINPEIAPGRLALVADYINMTGYSPLIGPNDDAIGPRFPGMADAYDPLLRATARRAGEAAGLKLAEGVMVHHMGPSFETPAQIRAYRLLGGDFVGMSMVPETVIARHCGLKVLGIGAVTNLGTGLGAPPSHDDTLAGARSLASAVGTLLAALTERWGAGA
ncbi:MAG: purine-nucleoside phosphorylase [Alphaproteobacteria bacterium]|nr:purine-nucleoside phosphorylase [Alphaproteobacteria bacterium]